MEATWCGKIAKSLVIFGSGIALSACAYAAFRYWKRRDPKSIDEGFEDVSKLEESPEKRIIVLGLESAGKSTVLAQVTSGTNKNEDVKPTEGFNVTCLHSGNISLNIWEIGGSESVRKYWSNFLQDTDLLVFVVDASDLHSLPLAVKEVKTLLGDDRLTGVPILVLANKQDRPGAMSPEEVADALDVGSIPSSKHKVKVLGTQTHPNSQARHPSIAEVERVLLVMSGNN
ncbi:hypothetical protein B7P43_G02658 [Cryptotermes secundus]|uniref:ADP-ribosylation factor-like protein 3 n=2 Tax=Cryptotermes secundus TaxID=105785 RepID=A0A2J7QCI6_9NEOP|nr:hypothetical protein B7P43_G02658 [Cryptotermes secundus]